jgi:hypothetical protein
MKSQYIFPRALSSAGLTHLASFRRRPESRSGPVQKHQQKSCPGRHYQPHLDVSHRRRDRTNSKQRQ